MSACHENLALLLLKMTLCNCGRWNSIHWKGFCSICKMCFRSVTWESTLHLIYKWITLRILGSLASHYSLFSLTILLPSNKCTLTYLYIKKIPHILSHAYWCMWKLFLLLNQIMHSWGFQYSTKLYVLNEYGDFTTARKYSKPGFMASEGTLWT